MFLIFLFVGYLRRTSNYLERIVLFDPTHMMSMTDFVNIDVETLRIDNGYSLEKDFSELIYMNRKIELYQTINLVDSCHSCVHGLLT